MAVNIGVNIQRSPNRINQALRDAGVNGAYPKLLFDFQDEYYLTGGSSKTFANAMTFARAGNATMVDSDGKIKWAPHNLLSYSENPSVFPWASTTGGVTVSGNVITFTNVNQNWTQPATTTASVGVSATATFVLSGSGTMNIGVARLGSGTYEESKTQITLTETPTAYSITHTIINSGQTGFIGFISTADGGTARVVTLDRASLYRSDLGGMVNNPDRGDSYVPTTSSAVYLPRRGHHKYNGDQWVNKGILVESEARTNLITYSEDISNAAWAKNVIGITQEADAFGLNMWSISDSSTSSFASLNTVITSLTAGTNFSFSILVKKDSSPTSQFSARIRFDDGVTTVYCGQSLNVDDGTFHGSFSAFRNSSIVEDWGTHWKMTVTGTVGSGYTSTNFEIFPAHNDASGSGGAFAVGTHVVGGIQLESGSTPSSYIPTNGATVTRAAETITVPYANLPWPTPTYIGDELVVSQTWGTPANYDNISTGTGSSVDVTAGTTDSRTALVITGLTAGKVYRVFGTLTEAAGATGFYVRDGATAGAGTILGSGGNLTQGESGEIIFVATSTAANILFARGAAEDFAVDGVSFREINPLSVSIAMMGEMDYADEDAYATVQFYKWIKTADNFINATLTTNSTGTGRLIFIQEYNTDYQQVDSAGQSIYTPNINVPYSIAGRHGSNFLNIGAEGLSYTANTNIDGLPELSTADFNLAFDYMGTVSEFRIWDRDIGDTGIAEATKPSTEPSLSLTFDGQPSSFTNTGLTV